MNVYYSPENNSFHHAPEAQQDWVLVEGILFEDTPFTIVSSDVVDEETVYYFAVDEGTKAAYLAEQAAIAAAYAAYCESR